MADSNDGVSGPARPDLLKEKQGKSKSGVLQSAVAMSAGTMASRVLGFVRDAVMMAAFDLTSKDAFVVAFKLPNFFRRVLGEGSLAVSFIPIFISQLKAQPGDSPEVAKARAQNLANGVYTLLTGVTLIICAFTIIFMDVLIQAWVGHPAGFGSIPGKVEQTVYLARIMFFYLYLVTTYAFFMAISNALKKFLIPAIAPAFFNLGFIVIALLPQSFSRVPGDLLAWGVIFGGVIQALMVAVLLVKLGFLPKLQSNIRVPGLTKVLKNMLPGILGLGVFQILSLVNAAYAARLAEGAQTYIYAGDRLLELPQSLIAISLGAALLPTYSSLLSEGKKEAMLGTANKYLKVLLFLALPSAVGLFFLAQPIVEVLFMRGKFDARDALATAQVTQVYCFLLLFSSVSKVLAPGFYAIQNTWLPAIVAGICVFVHIIVAYFWVDWYGLLGIVASTSLSGFLNMLLLGFAFRKYIGPLGFTKLFGPILKIVPGLLVMGLFLYWGYSPLQDLLASFLGLGFGRALALFISIALSVYGYFAISQKLGSEEAISIWGSLRRRF